MWYKDPHGRSDSLADYSLGGFRANTAPPVVPGRVAVVSKGWVVPKELSSDC